MALTVQGWSAPPVGWGAGLGGRYCPPRWQVCEARHPAGVRGRLPTASAVFGFSCVIPGDRCPGLPERLQDTHQPWCVHCTVFPLVTTTDPHRPCGLTPPTPHGSGGWKSRIEGPASSVPGPGPLPGCCILSERKGLGSSHGPPSKGTNPTHEPPPSQPHRLPQAPPPNTMALLVRIPTQTSGDALSPPCIARWDRSSSSVSIPVLGSSRQEPLALTAVSLVPKQNPGTGGSQ